MVCPVGTLDVFESWFCFFYPENETCNLKASVGPEQFTRSPPPPPHAGRRRHSGTAARSEGGRCQQQELFVLFCFDKA